MKYLRGGRISQSCIEAERAIISCVLLDNEVIDQIAEIVVPDDFYFEAHRKIFKEILALKNLGEPCSVAVLNGFLGKNRGEVAVVGGEKYLDVLQDYLTTSKKVGYYCQIVAEMAMKRKTELQ
jgi:replicative DNA helicase